MATVAKTYIVEDADKGAKPTGAYAGDRFTLSRAGFVHVHGAHAPYTRTTPMDVDGYSALSQRLLVSPCACARLH